MATAGCGSPPPSDSTPAAEAPAAPASGGSTAPTVWFEDVTEGTGLDFRHRHGGSGRRYMVETMGFGGGLVDLNGDSKLDIVLLQGQPLPGHSDARPQRDSIWRDSVWLNVGDGKFRDVTDEVLHAEPGYSMGMCAGDFDEDGDSDLVITRFGEDRLLLNTDGRLEDATAGSGLDNPAWATSCALADFNRDGCLDLAVVNYVDFTLATHRECSEAGLVAYCHPDAYGGVPDKLYAGRCDGTFEDVSRQAGIAVQDSSESKGLGVLWTDFDDDGWIDLYVSNDSTRNFLWRNRGDGTFEDVGVGVGAAFNEAGVTEAGMGVDAGDVDRDGRLDLYVANLDLETNTLYRQFDAGIFEDATRPSGLAAPSHEKVGFGVELFDADLDGDLDLYVANGHIIDNVAEMRATASFAQTDQLFVNHRGSFKPVSNPGPWFDQLRVSRSVAAGDLDGDGDQDLLITTCNEQPAVLFNRIADGRPAVVLDLSLPSGRVAVGARATLVDDRGVRHVEEARAGSGYLSQGGPQLHFGLPDGVGVQELIVRWPDGTEETVPGVQPASGWVTLIKPKSIKPTP
ncbi:MAG: CRTAC1 family protein [Acidobacteriota bacterium]